MRNRHPSVLALFLLGTTALVSAHLSGCGQPSVPYEATDSGGAPPDIETSVVTMSGPVTMTNLAASPGVELTGNVSRVRVNLSNASRMRFHFAASTASALILCRIEYSTDDYATAGVTLIPNVAASTTANATNVSGWTDIPAGALTDVTLRAVCEGNGVLDPVIQYVRIGYY